MHKKEALWKQSPFDPLAEEEGLTMLIPCPPKVKIESLAHYRSLEMKNPDNQMGFAARIHSFL